MVIDEKAKISIYAVAVCVPFVVGCILWLSSVDFIARANQDDLKTTKALLLEIREKVIRIEQRLADRSEK